jgi:hypothetical protein
MAFDSNPKAIQRKPKAGVPQVPSAGSEWSLVRQEMNFHSMESICAYLQ